MLLPKKPGPGRDRAGDPVEVFLYKDSSDRMIATTNEPKITLGGLAVLDVADVGRIGAFLDWGLEKDLLLPYKEQTVKVEKGDRCLVSLYIDKSGRLCATMKISQMLRTDSPYQKDDIVHGTVYGVSREYGVFVAVDNKYSARIPQKDVYGKMYPGQEIEARVAGVKADGKLDLSLRHKIPEQMDADARRSWSALKRTAESSDLRIRRSRPDPGRVRDEQGCVQTGGRPAFERGPDKNRQ